jgi:hypothetical protein
MATMNKLGGKTAYSGRRRPNTRTAGFVSHPDATGGEWDTAPSQYVRVPAGAKLVIEFAIPAHLSGQWIAFGGWFCTDKNAKVSISSKAPKHILTMPCSPDWSKFGSMWQGDGKACTATLAFEAQSNVNVFLWGLGCGVTKNPGCPTGNDFVECDAPSYLKRMHEISPEAHIWLKAGEYALALEDTKDEIVVQEGGYEIVLKSCNRCNRFLPINIHDERATLSFSNHCVATAPCKHSTFGSPSHATTGVVKKLTYGFQLECRYCKKYCVNWAHNPQRSAAQMKEDGARRRYFELLISELFQNSKQLAFKHKHGKELTDYIWQHFDEECFKCGDPLPTARDMNLDHTRPLALLWPLDETATALCASCNSSKSDKYPNEFYELPGELEALSKKTGIPLVELENPTPNMEVIAALLGKLDWFFDDFLTREEMTRELDGKIAAELVVKALQKTLDKCEGGTPIDLVAEYEKRYA